MVERNSITSGQYTLAILEKEEDFCCTTSFDCGESDLNEFFRNDAFNHKKELLAETYYLEPKKATEEDLFFPVAFVSFLNDSIEVNKDERKSIFGKYIKKTIPYPKYNYRFFPAVKIARLGVYTKYQRRHVGTSLLNMTKEYFLKQNRTGCRFLTVDAYNKEDVIKFYEHNGFKFLWDQDKEKETRIMFFDLKRFNPQI